MHSRHADWTGWAERLRRWGLDGFAAWLLEAGGPLTIVGAQALYFSQPLLRPLVPDVQITALANMLEDEDASKAFAALLRKDSVT